MPASLPFGLAWVVGDRSWVVMGRPPDSGPPGGLTTMSGHPQPPSNLPAGPGAVSGEISGMAPRARKEVAGRPLTQRLSQG